MIIHHQRLPTSVKNLAYSSESFLLSILAITIKVPKVTKINNKMKKNLVMYENEDPVVWVTAAVSAKT